MTVRTERDGPIEIVTIDRPMRKNAIDRETADALLAAFQSFDADETALAAVLCGAGDCFSAGADLKEIARGAPNRLAPDGPGPLGPTRMLLSKPVIAAVEGYAVAGGLELALWCDLRILASDSTLGVYCRRWGVPLIDGGTIRLPRLIGLSRALDLILTGRDVKADEALNIGLANRVVPPGASKAAAVALAKEISEFPQLCLKLDRLNAHRAWDQELPQALREEFETAQPALTEGLLERLTRFTRKD